LDYQIPSTDEMQKVSDELRAALGLKSETINNENVKENAANSGFSWTSTTDQTYTIYNPDLTILIKKAKRNNCAWPFDGLSL
jgi:hypothetical protein